MTTDEINGLTLLFSIALGIGGLIYFLLRIALQKPMGPAEKQAAREAARAEAAERDAKFLAKQAKRSAKQARRKANPAAVPAG